ncbi:MAG TPA: hypothetical protein VK541_08880 [Pedobacter sp.]|uniref:hypothetical protein n=1 Tax=Pedobacter sp. TaxID=1411316 RepID=UPI002CBFA571|nr:hypothetical protein [Pedobacter sp.]HMI02581.1 hypothetical protein [Pedobacter sp.]
MRSIKYLALSLLVLSALYSKAQDIIVIREGNFIRGTIKATNFSSVIFKNDAESMVQYEAKDIKEFVWNGETYVSKPILINKRMEFRFFRLLEQGTVNLYSIGGNTMAAEPPQKRAKVRPSVAVGGGTGGLGGGVGISIGGGRRSEADQPKRIMPTTYFIERLGTGPLMEIPVEGVNSEGKAQHIKNILLQKLTGSADISQRINATDTFDASQVKSLVVDYNSIKK